MDEIRGPFDAFFEALEGVARCFEELVVAIKEAVEKFACEFREAFMLNFGLHDVEYRGDKTGVWCESGVGLQRYLVGKVAD